MAAPVNHNQCNTLFSMLPYRSLSVQAQKESVERMKKYVQGREIDRAQLARQWKKCIGSPAYTSYFADSEGCFMGGFSKKSAEEQAIDCNLVDLIRRRTVPS